jgi:diguanylate cyclase (GGDEF)-like protein
MVPSYLLTTFWIGWRRWAAWSVCISMLLIIGTLRTKTDAELTSLALIPVLVIAWIGGKWNGIVMAFLAVAIWFTGDVLSAPQLGFPWIAWVNATTRFVTYGLVAILSAQIHLQFVKAYEYATTDSLTGLQNRRAFIDAGVSETERSKRYAHSLAVVFIDLDNFKQLNDAKGHDVGDMALQTVAKVLKNTLRSNDQITRLGGDEFAILLPEIEYEKAVETGHKISVAVNSALNDFSPATGSTGIAWFGKVDCTFPAMLKAADKLMYEVKASGKGKIRSQRF